MSQAGKIAADLSSALRCSDLEIDRSIYTPRSKYRNKFMSDMDKIWKKRLYFMSGQWK